MHTVRGKGVEEKYAKDFYAEYAKHVRKLAKVVEVWGSFLPTFDHDQWVS